MDTIFTYDVTKNELEEIANNEDILLDDYLVLLNKKATNNSTSVEYEATVDLQELFLIREDQSMANHFTNILNTDFTDIRNKLFTE